MPSAAPAASTDAMTDTRGFRRGQILLGGGSGGGGGGALLGDFSEEPGCGWPSAASGSGSAPSTTASAPSTPVSPAPGAVSSPEGAAAAALDARDMPALGGFAAAALDPREVVLLLAAADSLPGAFNSRPLSSLHEQRIRMRQGVCMGMSGCVST